MSKFLHKWALIRMCVGIFIVLDGYPLGFFLKETVGIPIESSIFTAGFISIGLLMMLPTTALRKLYAPNVPVFNALLAFVLMCVLYSFMFNATAVADRSRDLVYYLFVILFLLLLVNVPNEITTQIVIVGVIFTLVSNLALVYSLLTDPDWTLGQRAAIQFGPPGEKWVTPTYLPEMPRLACSVA